MRRSPTLPLIAGGVAGMLLLSACSLLPEGGGREKPDPGAAGVTKAVPEKPAGGFVNQGYLGSIGMEPEAFRAEVEIDSIQRWPDRTAVQLTLRSLEDEPVAPASSSAIFGGFPLMGPSPNDFHLIDPVGQHRYSQLVEKDVSQLGSIPAGDHVWKPGVKYKAAFFFPKLPESVGAVTLTAPGSVGEFTGVPVTDGEPTTFPSESTTGKAGKGDTVWIPVTDLSEGAKPVAGRLDLYGVVEEAVRERRDDKGRETVALRTDVLFAFDKAELGSEAEAVLADVVAETKERADPEKPPITITGHTDGIGDDDYNQELSTERAEAVRDVLNKELGSGYEYETEGKGATEPLEEEGGDDDVWARAQNRRVEISYSFKQDTAAEPEAPREEEEGKRSQSRIAPEKAGNPGRFHGNTDIEPVATRKGKMNEGRPVDIKVFPFYRDGAYLVARFEMTNRGSRIDEYALEPMEAVRGGLTGFEEFAVVDPATGRSYREVEVFNGKKDTLQGASSQEWLTTGKAGVPHYAYMYVAAPPADVDEVTFNAGPLGTFENIPIR